MSHTAQHQLALIDLYLRTIFHTNRTTAKTFS